MNILRISRLIYESSCDFFRKIRAFQARSTSCLNICETGSPVSKTDYPAWNYTRSRGIAHRPWRMHQTFKRSVILSASPTSARMCGRSRTPTSPVMRMCKAQPKAARSLSRSTLADSSSAIGGAFIRWRAGTARPTASRSEHTLRRWQHFGESGAKLIWGGEAFAVQSDGRANPNQIGVIDDDVERAARRCAALLETLTSAHQAKFAKTDDLLVGLQLTHSGRFCRPRDKKRLEPRIAYHHPILDRKFGIDPNDDSVVISDDYIERLIENYVRAAKLAHASGYQLRRCQTLPRLSRSRAARRVHAQGQIWRQLRESHALRAADHRRDPRGMYRG